MKDEQTAMLAALAAGDLLNGERRVLERPLVCQIGERHGPRTLPGERQGGAAAGRAPVSSLLCRNHLDYWPSNGTAMIVQGHVDLHHRADCPPVRPKGREA